MANTANNDTGKPGKGKPGKGKPTPKPAQGGKAVAKRAAAKPASGKGQQKSRKQGRAAKPGEKRGIMKTNVDSAVLRENWGIEGDAHAGDWHRQVSLLAIESIDKMRAKGSNAVPGNFAENITTEGIDLAVLKLGDKLRVGKTAVLKISKIGKECHKHCAIYHQVGDCIMPREGIFAEVLEGGDIAVGDAIEELKNV